MKTALLCAATSATLAFSFLAPAHADDTSFTGASAAIGVGAVRNHVEYGEFLEPDAVGAGNHLWLRARPRPKENRSSKYQKTLQSTLSVLNRDTVVVPIVLWKRFSRCKAPRLGPL